MVSKKENDEKKSNEIPGRKGTQVSINLANIIGNSDAQLFPTLYAQIQSSLGIDIIQLGTLTGVRSILQSISSPFWGWFSDKHSRRKILAIGCFIWAIFTILVAFGVSYIDLLIYRAITGIGLAVIVPTAQSLISDYFPPDKRGKAYGWLGLTGVFGIILGTLFATTIVSISPSIFGLDTWRYVFIIWGVISILIGIFTLIFAKDPIRGEMEPELKGKITLEKAEKYKLKLSDYKKIFTNKTFILIVLQGLAGTIPWNGILFMVVWFEYVGFDPLTSGLMFSLVAIGAAIGNLIGGILGDIAEKKYPDKGRIMIAQISVFAGIPLTFVMFYIIPMNTSSLFLYVIVGTITGLLITWAGVGCNNPIFSQVFVPEMRSSVFSVDRMFEGSFGALGSIFVGMAAAFFGFTTPPMGVEIKDLPTSLRLANMHALAQGMFFVAFIPWILCLILFTLVYFTYPRDRDRVRKILEERRKELENA
ncbi:MAG: spinster family MFS transporter [Promethearchaeota archaeon]